MILYHYKQIKNLPLNISVNCVGKFSSPVTGKVDLTVNYENSTTKYFSWSCHKQRHTGKRPFQCKLCDAKFFEGANLRRHAKQKHKLDKIRITDLDKNVDDTDKHTYNENLFSNI